MDQTPPDQLVRFPKALVKIEEGSMIPCPSRMSPTGMHFFARVQYRGEEKLMCRFCGTSAVKAMATASVPPIEHTVDERPTRFTISASNEVEKMNPADEPPVNEEGIERVKAAIREAMAGKEPGREAFEKTISRAHAEDVAGELTQAECHAYRRKVGRRKICVLRVEQGEGKNALLVEGADWWIVLRQLFSFLKNRGKLPGDQGGELVPA